MKPTKLLGWSIENPGRRSHLIGSAAIVVGTSRPGEVLIAFPFCGTARTGGSVQNEPNQTRCARCMGVAFKLARTDELPQLGE